MSNKYYLIGERELGQIEDAGIWSLTNILKRYCLIADAHNIMEVDIDADFLEPYNDGSRILQIVDIETAKHVTTIHDRNINSITATSLTHHPANGKSCVICRVDFDGGAVNGAVYFDSFCYDAQRKIFNILSKDTPVINNPDRVIPVQLVNEYGESVIMGMRLSEVSRHTNIRAISYGQNPVVIGIDTVSSLIIAGVKKSGHDEFKKVESVDCFVVNRAVNERCVISIEQLSDRLGSMVKSFFR